MKNLAAFFLCYITASQAFAVDGTQQRVLSSSNQLLHSNNQQKNAFRTKSIRSSSFGRSSKNVVLSMSSGGSLAPPPPPVVTELKTPAAIYEGAVIAGTAKGKASALKIFQLGIVAGIHIAFGAYLAISVGGNLPGFATTNPGLQKLIMGGMGLPTGLIMTLVTGAELFTGNTALVTAAYMENKIQFKDLLKNWCSSYVGNFVGSVLLAYLAFHSGTLGTAPGAVNLAIMKCSAPWLATFYKGILCNFLVCMAVYIASGCSSFVGKMSKFMYSRSPNFVCHSLLSS